MFEVTTLLDSDYEEHEYVKEQEHLLHPHKKPLYPPNNKTLGTAFERDLAEYLASHGFWVHLMAAKAAGQPADVIAVRNGRAYLIDAKECTGNTFPLSRVEANQHTAMTLWKECGNGTPWFAMRLADGSVFMVPYFVVQSYALDNKKAMTEEDIRFEGFNLEQWLEVMA